MKLKFLNLKKMYFKSLQVRIMLVILIFLFIPISLLLNYNFSHTESVLQEKTSSLVLGNLEQIGFKIESIAEDIMKISSITGSNSTILSELSPDFSTSSVKGFGAKDLRNPDVSDLIRINDVERQINYVKSNFFNYNTHVIIFGADGTIYSALGDVADEFNFKLAYQKTYKSQGWYRTLEAGGTIGLWTAPFYYDIEGFGKDRPYISLARIIKNNYTQNIQGIIMVNFSEDDFRRSLGSNVNGTVTLLNQDRKVIFNSKPDEGGNNSDIYSKLPVSGKGYFSADIEGRRYMINYYSIDRMGWILTSTIPYNDVMKEITKLRNNTYTISFLIFGAFAMISIALIMYLTFPLRKLIGRIRRMKIGDYRIGPEEVKNPDDVTDIVNSFDYMFKRVEELVSLVIQEQKYENDLKYEALRAQINPHFLLNTLNTIKWSALMSGSENVSKMITSLGKLLEISMNKGEDEITVKEEMELAESYVSLQNVRFNDIFKLVFDVDEQVKDYKVLKLLLQPIVENSIIHGLKHKVRDGVITVSASIVEDTLRIIVRDNGIGISRDKIDKILNGDSDVQKYKYTSIGLINIHERLKIKYGNRYGLVLESEEGSGTTVTIVLPVIRDSSTEV